MTTYRGRSTRPSKKAAAHISKFDYHLTHTIPDLFASQKPEDLTLNGPILRAKRGIRNMNFHFAQHSSEGVGSLDAQAILLSALKTYVGLDCVKISERTYKKTQTLKVSYLPIYGEFQEIIEFIIVDSSQETPLLGGSRWVKPQKQTSSKTPGSQALLSLTKSHSKKGLSSNFQLYVIHHCHQSSDSTSMRWQNFVQKYHFKEEHEDGQTTSKINYTCIFNYESSQGILGFKSYQEQLFQNFIKEHLTVRDKEFAMVSIFLGHLLQDKDRICKKMEELNDPAFDESHKKWLKLSPQYFKMYSALRKHTVQQHKELYGNEQHLSENSISSLTYRYMIAKEFNPKEVTQYITSYLKWQKTMSESFNLLMFEHFHSIDFYSFLGYDHEGRCVILNKAGNLMVDTITNVDDYCNYFCYFLQIYVPRKLKGYASEYLVLADLKGLGSDNFKLAITKRNVHDGTTYCPERQYKFIGVNVNSWGNNFWRVFNYLIPKRTLSKISFFGEDRAEILRALTEVMDISVIPQYLGGSNKRTYIDDLADERAYISLKSKDK